ncbi:hypothetical protein MTF66_02580 [Pseudoalteromonas sp. 2CM39R]|uniref:hypothetical protein n=1 Tax=Pseudoalteromonas sp. 2CM39R TaxID=2929856 RepID=UPI0020BF3CD5|nr:hypothetical protein [Pseudoalteromonas sp. 2CM39R]MCK8123868.1 hypothetical protein [Pseudoalteromonas sp. 2CM39R]|tara:strand:+ start:136 stop:429 length:294 start_codon:yes stop_codon:yes gene_type:complete
MKEFVQDEQAYLQWATKYKDTGFILNVDEPQNVDDYPKLHLARYKCVTSPKKTNYTNNEYFKVCSESRAELEAWSKSKYGKELTLCGVCFRKELKRN